MGKLNISAIGYAAVVTESYPIGAAASRANKLAGIWGKRIISYAPNPRCKCGKFPCRSADNFGKADCNIVLLPAKPVFVIVKIRADTPVAASRVAVEAPVLNYCGSAANLRGRKCRCRNGKYNCKHKKYCDSFFNHVISPIKM
jgi:hypothetical protein